MLLLAFDCCYTREYFALDCLEQCTATGGDVRNLVSQAELVDACYAVTAADERESAVSGCFGDRLTDGTATAAEIIELEYTCRTVPEDGLATLDSIGEDLLCLRTCIQTFPAFRNCIRRAYLLFRVVAEAIRGCKTILWNGPAGVFEFDNFCGGSRAIGEAIAEATANGAFSLIGGGDSVACVNKFGLADKVSYISTGGGALLEAIEGKVLPGVAAIKGE